MLKSSLPAVNRTEAASSTSIAKKKNHLFYISSLFDVFALLESDVQGTWGFRNSHMTIVTRDPDSLESMEWVIRGSAYGAVEIVLQVDGVYFLKGRLLALNSPGEQKFYYEPKNQILATTSRGLQGDLANAVSVHGLGVILSRELEPVSPGKDNVVVVVRHTDYNPEIRGLSSFDVQYRASWSPLMEKLQPLLTINREVLLVGHIIGRDTARHMWIVEITGVSVTSGPGNAYAGLPPLTGETVVTPGGCSRGKMIFGTCSPAESSPTPAQSTSSIKQASDSPPKKRGRPPNGGNTSKKENTETTDSSSKGKEKMVKDDSTDAVNSDEE